VRATPTPQPAVCPIAVDPATIAVFEAATAAAAARVPILIGGPSGTGKEVLARHVHAASPWAAGPFVAVNCAALPEAMAESLLFGHERGAFTGALTASLGLARAAASGTLFLDEIGELSPAIQAKLLRLLQEGELLPLGATVPVAIDCRIVAATNRDLHAEVAAGRFREDLLWRLAVFPLTLPPLVARPLDIAPLAQALLERMSAREGQAPPLTCATLALLQSHHWPGNVRELHNVLARAAILAAGGPIEPRHLRFDPAIRAEEASPAPCIPPIARGGDGLLVAVRAGEARAIAAALAETGGRKAEAARRLGIAERTLRYRLAALAGRPRAPARVAA
jgi:two-component system response regulator FlrC